MTKIDLSNEKILGSSAHARILYAYLSRLTLADLERIAADALECHRAAMNGGMSTQLAAQEQAMLTVVSAAGRLIDYDKGVIEETIRHALRGQ